MKKKCKVQYVYGSYQCGISTKPIYATVPCGVTCRNNCYYNYVFHKQICSYKCTTNYCTKLVGYQNTPIYCTGVHEETVCKQECVSRQFKHFEGSVRIEKSHSSCFWSSWCSTAYGSCSYRSGFSC